MKIVSLTFFRGGSEGAADCFNEPGFGFVSPKSSNYTLLSPNKPKGFGDFFGFFVVMGEG